ncbi:Alpha/beta knot methyltransferase [Catenaria anguillulae PL171]|uniref:Alpha/beta knot methyltransferase n=1 Tax=Catenaria anguillulae PL171 TaxID=765915 RepID=A0A1Y2HP46_9FUNG|nr:Alpha/beta knot methyltransferase [Catenaria anguillulae PL171]
MRAVARAKVAGEAREARTIPSRRVSRPRPHRKCQRLTIPGRDCTTLAPALPVQRKINPWAAMLQADVTTSADAQAPADSTSRLAAMQAAIRTLGPRGRLDLVVCASLVELNTNLGGLARTCEIFGLRGLTVARGEPLVDWLRAMKRKHYVIVALEQTAQVFPEKMVLLLGKEKEGVPGELLAEVDMCIEIPQLGVTRSLNVHNAACTICWEYVRRRLVD